MKVLLLIGALLALGSADFVGRQKRTPIHGPPDYLNFKCFDKEGVQLPDGFYADLHRGCHQYYHCVGGKKTTYFCKDPRTIFSETIQACVSQEFYSCPSLNKDVLNTCEGRKDGFYADLESRCDKFYRCVSGHIYTFHCPPGTIFDETRDVCDHRSLVICPDYITPTSPPVVEEVKRLQRRTPIHGHPDYLNFKCEDEDGNWLPNGFYADLHRGCHQFYQCIRGERETYVCQDSETIFDDTMNACVSKKMYSCPSVKKRILELTQRRQEIVARSLLTQRRQEIVDRSLFHCEKGKDGFFADRARRCQMFHRCVGGHKYTFSCPPGTLFDETRAVCDYAALVICPTYIEPTSPPVVTTTTTPIKETMTPTPTKPATKETTTTSASTKPPVVETTTTPAIKKTTTPTPTSTKPPVVKTTTPAIKETTTPTPTSTKPPVVETTTTPAIKMTTPTSTKPPVIKTTTTVAIKETTTPKPTITTTKEGCNTSPGKATTTTPVAEQYEEAHRVLEELKSMDKIRKLRELLRELKGLRK